MTDHTRHDDSAEPEYVTWEHESSPDAYSWSAPTTLLPVHDHEWASGLSDHSLAASIDMCHKTIYALRARIALVGSSWRHEGELAQLTVELAQLWAERYRRQRPAELGRRRLVVTERGCERMTARAQTLHTQQPDTYPSLAVAHYAAWEQEFKFAAYRAEQRVHSWAGQLPAHDHSPEAARTRLAAASILQWRQAELVRWRRGVDDVARRDGWQGYRGDFCACAWHRHDDELIAAWYRQGVAPYEAATWANHGYTLDRAAPMIADRWLPTDLFAIGTDRAAALEDLYRELAEAGHTTLAGVCRQQFIQDYRDGSYCYLDKHWNTDNLYCEYELNRLLGAVSTMCASDVLGELDRVRAARPGGGIPTATQTPPGDQLPAVIGEHQRAHHRRPPPPAASAVRAPARPAPSTLPNHPPVCGARSRPARAAPAATPPAGSPRRGG
jgi:hypothetical protein